MYIIFREAPFLRMLIPAAAGILSGISLSINLFSSLVVISGCILPLVFFLHKAKKNIQSGLLLQITWFLLFWALTDYRTTVRLKDKIGCTGCLVQLIEGSGEKKNSLQVTGEILSCKDSDDDCRGKAILYFTKSDKKARELIPGDIIYLESAISSPAPPRNPGQFDYATFLRNKGIGWTSFNKEGTWDLVSQNSTVRGLAWKCRLYSLQQLKKLSVSDSEYGILAAMLTGYRNELDPETSGNFAAAGATHVLAVSGLHVGIIFLFVNLIIGKILLLRNARIGKALVVLFLLWFYAFFTGLSPSVLRASTMFSIILLARTFSKGSNIFNTLSFSAVMLLFINPLNLLDIGFQLSYLAVAGIISIHPLLCSIWNPAGKALQWLRDLSGVTMAAQISTFPVCLYYFEQFPNYFMFSNLLVVPLAGFLLYTGVLYLILGEIPLLSHVLGAALEFGIFIMDKAARLISNLPASVSKGLSISAIECISLYMVTICFLLLISRPGILRVIVLQCSILIWLLAEGNEKVSDLSRRSFTAYYSNSTGIYSFIMGEEKLYVISGELPDEKWQSYNLPGENLEESLHFENGWEESRLITWGDLNFFLVGKQMKRHLESNPDYIVINRFSNLSNLQDILARDTVFLILDANCSPVQRVQVNQIAEKRKLKIHDVRVHGALQLTQEDGQFIPNTKAN